MSTDTAAHTQGPWHYESDGMGDFTIASSADPLAIAAVVNGTFMAMGGHAKEHEANARLIAAAPEMLAALRGLVREHIKRGPFDEPLGQSEQSPQINAALAAISKAQDNPQ